MSIVWKTVADGDGFDFVMSDATVDSYGDIVEPKGWDLSRFMTNPIALWDHGKDPEIGRMPLGIWENVRVSGGKLMGHLKAFKGSHPKLDGIITLVENRVLRASSVGFQPLAQEPIDKNDPFGGQRYTKQILLETSIVAIPANPAAVALAKSLNISDETISLAFGEHADVRRRDVTATGEQADRATADQARTRAGRLPLLKDKSMKTLSQRIEDAGTTLTANKDRLAELTSADAIDVDAIEALNAQIEVEERGLAALKASEAKIGLRAASDAGVQSPSISRRPLGFPQRELTGVDLLVRRAVVHACSLYSGKDIDQVLEQRYPGHEATSIIAKAAQTVGTSTTSGWAAELVQTTWTAFLDALRGKSVYPVLRDRGFGVSFDAAGTAYIPQLTAGGANGSFFGEGSPIRVGRITVAAPTMTARKMGVIIPFTREAAKRSTPSLEGIVRKAIIDDTSAVLDSALLDATAGDSVRPAGLLNSVSATAAGYGGGDHVAVKEDFKALLSPFIDANVADGITVIMNPKQGLAVAMMDGPTNNPAWFSEIAKRVTIVESTHATAGRLIAVRNADFATATGDVPEFEVSNQATVHMEDAAPLEIVSATGPTTANPVRSFWQTDSMGVRMVMDVSWRMSRSGMVRWIDGTSY